MTYLNEVTRRSRSELLAAETHIGFIDVMS